MRKPYLKFSIVIYIFCKAYLCELLTDARGFHGAYNNAHGNSSTTEPYRFLANLFNKRT